MKWNGWEGRVSKNEVVEERPNISGLPPVCMHEQRHVSIRYIYRTSAGTCKGVLICALYRYFDSM